MKSLYFYDLETSGFNARSDRIMQFGGQRTDMELKPIGEPHNYLIKLSDDLLPSPDAILVTGITPQKVKAEGLTELEFLKIFHKEISVPDTIFVGFNSIRFDDEFMRFLNWRNFFDAYEWQWKDGRGRWDLLDLVRMTRALRPEGIKWPVDVDGKAVNRLEMLASLNKLEHSSAHDALSDVQASIALAKLLKTKQPKLFDWLLQMRDKKRVSALVNAGEPFIYVSGKYQAEYEKTTIAIKIGDHPKKQGALVYDLRYDPAEYLSLSPDKLVKLWQYDKDREGPGLPVKTLLFNRCPAIAPLAVLDDGSKERLKLNMDQIEKNRQKLVSGKEKLLQALLRALEIMDKKQQTKIMENTEFSEDQLYDRFVPDNDKKIAQEQITTGPEHIANIANKLSDERLKNLILPYLARNFYKKLDSSQTEAWEDYRTKKLVSAKLNPALYFKRLEELFVIYSKDKEKKYILEELKLYAESIMPEQMIS
ncbi:MAG TPA: exodeoxyribonuclease I [Candidatus Saccharibacteria bacterium]|nr:exodeoxyribonuclease I [Candidatus Saccharibacteria bacterium]